MIIAINEGGRADKEKPFELVDVVTGETIERPAKLSLSWSTKYFNIFFDVEDDHIWGTYSQNDDPIWQEEVIEAFLSFGDKTPKEYFELQFSPKGIKYDAWVKNPTGNRQDGEFQVNVSWNFKNLEFSQSINATGDPMRGRWQTHIKIPAQEIKGSDFVKGDLLRGNFFRIDGYPKQSSFQALKPNFEKTPNFHTPDKFAKFILK